MTARIAIIALTLALLFAGANAMVPELPPDEAGLGALIEEQAIDSFQYGQLLVYYALPLSVPQGELTLLAQLFPDIGDLLPAPDTLESYRPFDNRQIQRLFNDFPALANFEPVLRFNASPSAQANNGEIVFGINKSGVSELRGHRARFRVKSKRAAAEGSVSLNDTGAMWQTRRVDFSRSGISAQAGNFKLPIPGELFFGRFSPLALADENGALPVVAANWLYGGSNTWNGVAVSAKQIPKMPKVGASAFCHLRGGERAAGGAVDYQIGRQIRVNAGLSGFETVEYVSNAGDGADDIHGDDEGDDAYDDSDDGGVNAVKKYIYTAHLYGEYRRKTWRAIAETGLPFGQAAAVPALSLRFVYRVKESFAEYHYTGYPDGFLAPMSRVKRQILSEAGEKESALSPSVQKHSLRMTVPISIPAADAVKLTPELDFTECSGTIKRVQGRAEVRARVKGVDVAVRHASKIFTMGIDSVLHTSSITANVQTDYPLEIKAAAQSVYGYYKNSRSTYTLELHCTALPNTVISPYVRGRYAVDHEGWLGVKTELHLYKKTWTGITLEMPAGVKGADNVYIKGSSSYAF